VTPDARIHPAAHDAGVNVWLLRASWWQLGVVMGALICPVFVLLFAQGGRSWPVALLMGLGVAVVCGPIIGYVMAHEFRRSLAAAGPLSDDARIAVERATRGGPVPDDDDVRAAALRVVEDRLIVLRATRPRAVGLMATLALVTGFLAVTGPDWWWIAVGACLVMLVVVLAAPARLRRRAEVLRGVGRR
jgi:hypothetical protein